MNNIRTRNIEEFVGEMEKASESYSPTADKGKELNWECHNILITKTNHHGDIEYANEAFLKATGYKAHELVNKPHNIVKHPDMPVTIYECMKRSLIDRGQFVCFIKIKTKDNNYFWAEEHCELRDDPDGPLIYMRRYFVKHEIIVQEVIPLYNNLRELERSYNVETSLAYLKNYLETFSATTCKELVEGIKKKYA